jgi:hypothetical protein
MRFCRPSLKLGDFFQQHRVVRIEKIAQDVNLGALVFGGQLRAGNELHLHRRAGRRRAGAAFDRVMVGERNARQAALLRAQNKFLRREGPVGKLRVQMKIGKFHQSVQKSISVTVPQGCL